MPSRIAIVTACSLLRPVGGGLRALYQARGLWETGFRDFTVFSREPDPRLPFPQETLKAYGPAEFVFTQPRGYALIHAHHNCGLFLKGRLWADLSGWGPLEAGSDWRRHPLKARAAVLFLLNAWAVRRLARRSERLICAAESVAQNVRRALPAPPPIDVIRNALDPGEFTPAPCAEPVVGVIGGFTSRWGRPALDLALRVAAECPEIPFRLIGRIDPKQHAATRQFTNIEVLGETDEAGFKEFFKTVSIGLVPYDDWCRGGASRLKLLQAAAAGLAIVATPAGLEGFEAPPETLLGRTPTELADAIRQLAVAKGRQRRGLALRRHVEQYHHYLSEGRRLAKLYQQAM